MKKLLVLGIFANCLFINLNCMEQEEKRPKIDIPEQKGSVELKQPRTLVQALVPIVAKLVDIKPDKPDITKPDFETLPFNMQEQILIEKGTIYQILDFAIEYPDHISNNLIQIIPEKLLKELIAGEITIEELLDLEAGLTYEVQDRMLSVFKAKILNFLGQDRIMHAYFMIKMPGVSSWMSDEYLPIDFWEYKSNKMKSRKPIIETFGEYLALFIGQQLQQMILDELLRTLEVKDFQKDSKGRKLAEKMIAEGQLLIDEHLLNELKRVFNQLDKYVEAHYAEGGLGSKEEEALEAEGEENLDWQEYVDKLSAIFTWLTDKRIVEIIFKPYIFDPELGAYVREKIIS